MRKYKITGLCMAVLLAAVFVGGCFSRPIAEGAAKQQAGAVQEPSTGAEEPPEAGEPSGAEETPGTEELSEAVVRSVYEIYQEIEGRVSLHSPVVAQDSFISNYYGIDVAGLEDYVFVMSEEATSAETIAIMEVKDSEDIEPVCSALQLVLDEKRSEMENYLPEQFQIVDKSSVKTKGNYVYLVISEQAKEIETIIEGEIS